MTDIRKLHVGVGCLAIVGTPILLFFLGVLNTYDPYYFDCRTISKYGGTAFDCPCDEYSIGGRFPNATDDTLATLPHLKPLATLDLDYSQITDKGLPLVVKHPRLVQLSLRNTKITDQGIEALVNEARRSGHEFYKLYLDDTLVTDRSVEVLVDVAWPLTDLSLRNTRITSKGVRMIGKMRAIFAIDLGGVPLHDEDLKSLPRENLCRLSLRNTSITDRGLEYLYSFPQLDCLDISKTKVTKQGIAKLESHAPNIQFLIIDDSAKFPFFE